MGGFEFISPFVLAALVVLPAIWWLLKLTPPRPRREVFPPLAILLSLAKRDETPAKSPWWLTLLRMALATLVVLAIANPVINPDRTEISSDGPLALLIDNGWASAEDWAARTSAADALIEAAGRADQPVALAFTADRTADTRPVSASEARQRLAAAEPQAARPERLPAASALVAALDGTPPAPSPS
nr:BatA domain-containing protein [Marinicella sp. W31]MDC2878026.1 BatA domain-containing protein [Marinicella sp. W31]